jgi:hypothetical protein
MEQQIIGLRARVLSAINRSDLDAKLDVLNAFLPGASIGRQERAATTGNARSAAPREVRDKV